MAIEDVDQVIFWFHDPRFFAFLQDWNVAMDTVVTADVTLRQVGGRH